MCDPGIGVGNGGLSGQLLYRACAHLHDPGIGAAGAEKNFKVVAIDRLSAYAKAL